MTGKKSPSSIKSFFKEKVFIFLSENGKLVTQFLFTALFIFMAAWFISHEKEELQNVQVILTGANLNWIAAGFLLVLFYIFIQGIMYVASFASINVSIFNSFFQW
jgi:phosphatidylglycerol lysyltransferase